MTYSTQLFNKLEQANDAVRKANEEKTQVIDNFLEDITDTCNIFYELWEKKQEVLEQMLKKLGEKYQFTFTYGYNGEFSMYQIIEEISCLFPIKNYSNEAIIDSLPGTNEQWYLCDKSTNDMIKIEVEPFNNNSRYPSNPDENQEAFIYLMPSQLHQQLSQVDSEQKETLIEQYMDKTINEKLVVLEEKIQSKSKVIKQTIDKIDFNDPAVVAELRNKLKM